MKIRPNIAGLAALTLGVALAAAPAFAQVSHRDMQKTGSAANLEKLQTGQQGYSPQDTRPLYNYVPPQSAAASSATNSAPSSAPQQNSASSGGMGCTTPLSPGGAATEGGSCGGPGYNPASHG
jgi:hypothetical protein